MTVGIGPVAPAVAAAGATVAVTVPATVPTVAAAAAVGPTVLTPAGVPLPGLEPGPGTPIGHGMDESCTDESCERKSREALALSTAW